MNKYKIAIMRKDMDDLVVEWNAVPRVGETVGLGDSHHPVQYEITDIIHFMRRGIGSEYGEIGIKVIEPKF